MTQNSSQRSLIPFAAKEEASEFGSAVMEKVMKEYQRLLAEHVPPENVAVFPHGKTWTFQQQRAEGFAAESGEFKAQSTEFRVHDDRIFANDLSLVDELVTGMSKQMADGFKERLFAELNDVCEKADRVTKLSKNGPIADALLESIEDIQCGVDADGNVSMPTLSLSPDMIERLQRELLIRKTELEKRAQQTREKLERDALTREADRKAKFRRK